MRMTGICQMFRIYQLKLCPVFLLESTYGCFVLGSQEQVFASDTAVDGQAEALILVGRGVVGLHQIEQKADHAPLDGFVDDGLFLRGIVFQVEEQGA